MRFVKPTNSRDTQNLVACQIREDILFFAIRDIPKDTELLVWYCREFEQRMRNKLEFDVIQRRNAG